METEIKGTTMQILEVTLNPGESVISTHGELSWMTPNISMSQTTATGKDKGFAATLKRAVAGGGLLVTRYEAQSAQGKVAFAAKQPGKILELSVTPGQGYLVHRKGWLCGTPGIVCGIGFQQSIRGGLWGGEGFIFEKMEGEGTFFLELSGEIVAYDLTAGQSLLVHPGHIGAITQEVNFQITQIPGIANKLFGQDGFHLVNLTGPGKVLLQSMPIVNLAEAIAPYLTQSTGNVTSATAAGGFSGVLGGILGSS
ncbi:MAG: AIM24 family protein [Firmicutes bacterium]|jgi:uncharacterized protein (AIM24 family)|nr:AIM24 family protein [Bacillota bacterium]